MLEILEKLKFILKSKAFICYEVIDPQHYGKFEEMAAALIERRKGKCSRRCTQGLIHVNYFGGLCWLHLGSLMEWVSGAIHSTASTVRPASSNHQTRPNVTRTSGAFMVRGTERYLFGD